MEPNQFEEKAHELEEALTERSGEIARSRASEAEHQKLLVLQRKSETLLKETQHLKDDKEKHDFIRQANELLLELRQRPLA
ncbi:hypothetical protein [Sulfitobacter faviae]|jgi:hypothetical protein|uniref:hypothetical protein n=1 Tax=Sulfitobacter faviae TaxID=1775881 RepID=UPI0024548979|nr:hypothetical protein [Sulfitobacter faviae]MDH4541644.1 hypothetical protein [Sulfitobacter faviae]